MSQTGKNNGIFWGGMLILFGVLFLLDNFYFLDFGDIISTYWPLILVAIGVKILFDHRRQQTETDEFKSEQRVDIHGGTSQTDGISESNVFGDINLNIASENFLGGSVSNVFGDMKLDISKSKLQTGTTKVFISGVFGDVTVVAPKDIPLKTRNTSVAGDINVRGSKKDGLFPKLEQTEDAYETSNSKLFISVSIVFGSINIY
jgi:predicted membrane protein